MQFDFLVQAHLNGRAEFSIPGASKKRNGDTGYADIASITTSEIWEIKPEHLEDQAVSEAAWYSQLASKSCGSQWRAGTSFTTTNRYGIPGVVYRIEGSGIRADLIAKQGRAGAVLYYWEINGKREAARAAALSWALRQVIVRDYFSVGQTLQPLPGSKAPDNLPPGKFKPPVLMPGDCIPELGKFLQPLLKSIRTTCTSAVFEGGAVAVLLESSVYNGLVGPRIVAAQKRLMQVDPGDPTVKLYRQTIGILTATVGVTGILAIVLAGGEGAAAAMIRVVEMIGEMVVIVVEVVIVETAMEALVGGVLGTLSTGLRNLLPTTVAAGAGFLVFATPRASMADATTPVSVDVFLPKFVVLPPSQVANARIGQSTTLDGAEWFIAGIARTPPD